MTTSHTSPLRFLAASLLASGLSFASIAHAADINIVINADSKTEARAFDESGNKMFPLKLRVDDTITIGSLKTRIEEETASPAEMQSLSFGGNELEDGKTVVGYGIKEGATVDLKMP